MKILLIHQNFPGQFKHLAPELVRRGHEVVTLTLKARKEGMWNGVQVLPYALDRKVGVETHPWLTDLNTKLIRARGCLEGAIKLKERGFSPDVIVAHHGWGEPMFLKDVWPQAVMGLYCELYHHAGYPHSGFDPEFENPSPGRELQRIRMKNLNNHVHFDVGDAGLSPTKFQADTFPPTFRDRITVVHDGIDTEHVSANPDVSFEVEGRAPLTRDDEVITFINRNLEPYRGYHIFMRALPELLKQRPNAQVLIVGGDGTSYGAKPKGDKSWKQIFIDEVRGDIPDADWARVHFLGNVPYERFLKMIQVSRVHVYLTYPFVLSWSLLESMSAECAIVASDTDPVREAITDGETGRLVDFFDRDALLGAVSNLLDDSNERKRLGAAARAHVVENYDLRTRCLPAQVAWVEGLASLTPRQPEF